ncbi:MAG: two-component system sensor histidine kinase NtrB [Candidatus Binataceae bacterium]
MEATIPDCPKTDLIRPCRSGRPFQHEPSDAAIEPTQGELDIIRGHLHAIEKMLAGLFGPAYDGSPDSLEARVRAAALVDAHLEEVVESWSLAVEQTFDREKTLHRPSMTNSLVRFIAHLRDPADLRTYVHLRRHCQEGMLSRAKPSEFNIFHIALKQVILNLVRARMRGKRMEIVRDTVVAAIDERRLMVAQFYIESREHALRASEEKYRNSINHAPDPMYEIDPPTLTVKSANSAALDLHDILPYEQDLPLIGQPLISLVPPEMQPHVFKHIATVKRNGSDQALDLPIRGRFFDVNSALIPHGNEQFIQMILHDVTQRHEMLDTLLKAERLAAAGTFASGVAHEVNNPLASISSLVQSLLNAETDIARRTTMHTILSQITRISTTLKDLVNFARPAPGERKALDINALVAETLRLIAYNKRFSKLTIQSALAPDLKPAFADSNGIQQVVLNLLFNAADARPQEGGLIRIVSENKRAPHNGDGIGRVVMRISDNGAGIAPEHLERVFDPFFTTKPSGSGVGLGLSLCQSIILTNQGTIRIESQLGKGTTVTISLPAFSHMPELAELPTTR